MRGRYGVMAMAIGFMATPAAGLSPYRLVAVICQPGDPRGAQQNAALQRDAAALHERDVVVRNLTPEAARRERPEWRVDAKAEFEVLLVGKDGEVKLRRQTTVAPSEIAALIDPMPMRQEEEREEARRKT